MNFFASFLEMPDTVSSWPYDWR